MLAALLAATPAHAQTSASLSLDSDYRFRGVPLGDSRPSARAEIGHDAAGGWYAGASAAQAGHYKQVTAYGGRVWHLDGSLDLDTGASAWLFNDGGSYKFAEVYAGLIARLWSLRADYSPNYFGQHVQTLYVDGAAHYMITDAVRIFAHAGELFALTTHDAAADFYYGDSPSPAQTPRSRRDFRAGAGWTLGAVDLQLARTFVTSGGPYPSAFAGRRAAWVASASWAF